MLEQEDDEIITRVIKWTEILFKITEKQDRSSPHHQKDDSKLPSGLLRSKGEWKMI